MHTIPHECSFGGEITMNDRSVADDNAKRTLSQIRALFLARQTMPGCEDYPAILLTLRVEGRALERAKGLKCDTGAFVRAPAEALRASRRRISGVRDYIPLPGAMRIYKFLERL